MARARLITVRLDDVELAALRKLPGENDAARLRTLLHANGATDGLAAKIADEVSEKLKADVEETQRLIRALGPLLDQMYRRLIDHINTRRPLT
ncbi:MAG: hypothetical protein ACRETA_07690 [Gammaproteobacteria bacterium]